MQRCESATEIDDTAAVWAIRLEERQCDPDLASELDVWLAGDPRRSGALLRAQAALCFLQRGRALEGTEAFASPGPAAINRRKLIVGGGAAGLAAAAGIAGVSFIRRVPVVPSLHYATLMGEVLRVPLQDGTVATLNTATQIDVAFTGGLRAVSLIAGEALFEVAEDALPFVVSSGPVRFKTLRTTCSIRRRNAKSSILVTEGTVDAWVSKAGQAPVHLKAGNSALISDDGTHRVTTVDSAEINRQLAWRTGEIFLTGQTVEEAVEEFNRYSAHKILVANVALAHEKVVGRFRSDQPEAFANAVATTLQAGVVRDGNVIRLVRATLR